VENSAPTPWSVEIASCAGSFAAGEVSALGRLFDLCAPRLLRYAQTLTRRQEDAEDAVQAAVVRIARNPQSLAAARFPWAYLLRTVRNEALRLLARKRPAVTLAAEQQAETTDADRLAAAETVEAIQSALGRLPAEQAEVVVLKIWEGLTFQEIATVTGESLNTVASRYRYAIAKLETSLRRVAWEVGYVVE
jgi:RNA polymerase sigma-70 factor, ECF subfamily